MKKAVAVIITITILVAGLAFNNVMASDPDDMPDVLLPPLTLQQG